MKQTLVSFVLVFGIALLPTCGPKKAVQRTAVDTTIDLSGRWNDTDSRLVSEAMTADCLSRPWITRFESKHNRPPVVLVGRVKNRSHDRIPTETFTKDLERALINSGRVDVVADSGQRGELREEKQEQAMYASEETQKEVGQETGADYMIQGQINSILDQAHGQQVRYYQIELELINLLTNRKAWIGSKKIKKVVDQKKVGW